MPESEKPMTKEQAEQYQKQLAMLSEQHVQDAYRTAFSDCALVGGKPPAPSTIQRLLCAWKVLWRWHKG